MNIPVTIDVIGRPSSQLTLAPTALDTDQFVEISEAMLGRRFEGNISSLNVTGAAIESNITLPLMSRVALEFALERLPKFTALGIVMWRRTEQTEIAQPDRPPLVMKPGFGVLFEAMNTEAHREIIELIREQSRV